MRLMKCIVNASSGNKCFYIFTIFFALRNVIPKFRNAFRRTKHNIPEAKNVFPKVKTNIPRAKHVFFGFRNVIPEAKKIFPRPKHVFFYVFTIFFASRKIIRGPKHLILNFFNVFFFIKMNFCNVLVVKKHFQCLIILTQTIPHYLHHHPIHLRR
jgi:hypothetical protein